MLKQPESVDECVYFTRRALVPKGKIMAWALRIPCPKCKTLMKKPGKRAQTYDCPKCGYAEDKATHEKKLTVGVVYTCPSCGASGESSTEFVRKSWNGVKAFVFLCASCKEKIGITKKMKDPKKKTGAATDDEDDDDE